MQSYPVAGAATDEAIDAPSAALAFASGAFVGIVTLAVFLALMVIL